MPGGQQPHALADRARSARATSVERAPDSTRSARSSASSSSRAPTSRRSEVALPPTATACVGIGDARAPRTPRGVLRGPRASSVGRAAGRSAGSRRRASPEPTRQRRRPRHALGDACRRRSRVEPPPTSTTRDAPSAGWPSVSRGARRTRAAPPRRRRGPRPRAAAGVAHRPRRPPRFAALADAPRSRPPGCVPAPSCARGRTCVGHDVGDLVDLARGRSRPSSRTPLPRRGEGALLASTSRSCPPPALGHQQPGRVRSDVDAGAMSTTGASD